MWSISLLRKHWNKLQALRRERDGVAAIEFSLIAIPFFILLFAILETGYIFLLSVMLEGATADGARQVRTGEVTAATPATFQNTVCTNMYGMIDCDDFLYDVRIVPSFGGIPPEAVPVDQASATFAPGSPDAIVVVRVMYRWNFITPLLENLLGADANGTRHLISTVAFRNEPF